MTSEQDVNCCNELSEREYRAWLARLAPKSDTKATGLVLGVDLVLAYFALRCATDASWIRFLTLPLLAQVLVHAYVLQHECLHRSATRGPWNELLGCVLGMVVLLPFHARRSSHNAHHKAPGHLENDPANTRAAARLRSMSPEQLRLLDVLWRAWIPVLVANDRLGLLQSCFAPETRARGALSDQLCMGSALALHSLAAGYCLATQALHFTLITYVAAFLALLVVEEAANLPHHLFDRLESETLPPWRQMRATHSCRELPFLSRYVLLNFGAHTAHHVFSTLPWTRLPEVQRELVRRNAVTFCANEWSASRALRRRAFADVFAGYLAPCRRD